MIRTQITFKTITALLLVALTIGCGDKSSQQVADQQSTSQQNSTKQSAKTSTSGHGHPHNNAGGHGHPHENENAHAPPKDSEDNEDHSHGAGPHDGTLADWGGGKFHVEFTVDHDKQEATVYVFGSDEKTPVPISTQSLMLTIKKPQFQTELLPVPLENETDGKSSRFVGTHERLATVMEYDGIISAAVDGTPYAGSFKEKAHDDHSHPHEGEEASEHSHGEEDALVWVGEPKKHAGLVIKLGHHGKQLHAGENVEPAVSITLDEKPVDDAEVFNALFSADGETQLAEEVGMVFEPTTEEEPAHYAQGTLTIPHEVSDFVIRFRIAISDADEVSFDLPVAAE